MPVYSLFPKMSNHLSLDGLTELLLESGFDCVDLVVRHGFWVTPDGLASEAGSFVRHMRRHGVGVVLATTSYTPDMLLRDAKPLEILADAGIADFRMGYFPYKDSSPLSVQMEEARAQMERMAELCSKHGLRAVYQVHHGYSQLLQHSFSALSVVQGLPPEHVGIMLDPGNQFHEGREHYGKAAAVLGDYVAVIGVKDVAMKRDAASGHAPGKGWSADWAPCHEGAIDWHEIGAGLRKLRRQVVVNMQPFYYPQRHDLHRAALKEELAYVKQAFGEGNGSHEQA